MSVRREVVSLSQLLRRNEKSSPRRGTGRAPPLPLQTSRRRADTPLNVGARGVGLRQTPSAPITEKPASSGYQALTFTQRVRDAKCVATSQTEFGASSQTSIGFPALSQEVYDPESEQLSAMTSMSQSSFSQTQSQNLLGSQGDQLHCLHQWQAQQVPPCAPASVRCDGSEKLQELEQSITKTFIEQTRDQKHQQKQLMARLTSPIKKSIEEIMAKITTTSEGYQHHRAAIGEIEKNISNVAESVTELCQQSIRNKAACEEAHTTVVNEAAAVKAVLTELQTRVKTVEGSVKSCSKLVSRVLEVGATKHEALLSAVTASSCTYPKEDVPAETSSSTDRASRKRRRSPRRQQATERNPVGFSPPADEPPSHTRATSPPRYEVDSRAWYDNECDEANEGGLHLALQRIESLRVKRRHRNL